jgi:hypothetical protein
MNEVISSIEVGDDRKEIAFDFYYIYRHQNKTTSYIYIYIYIYVYIKYRLLASTQV